MYVVGNSCYRFSSSCFGINCNELDFGHANSRNWLVLSLGISARAQRTYTPQHIHAHKHTHTYAHAHTHTHIQTWPSQHVAHAGQTSLGAGSFCKCSTHVITWQWRHWPYRTGFFSPHTAFSLSVFTNKLLLVACYPDTGPHAMVKFQRIMRKFGD